MHGAGEFRASDALWLREVGELQLSQAPSETCKSWGGFTCFVLTTHYVSLKLNMGADALGEVHLRRTCARALGKVRAHFYALNFLNTTHKRMR